MSDGLARLPVHEKPWRHRSLTLVIVLLALQCVWLAGEAALTARCANATPPPLLYSDPPFARVKSPNRDLGLTPVCLQLVPGTQVTLSRPGYAATYRVPEGGARHGEVVELAPAVPLLTPLLLRFPLFAAAVGVLAAQVLRRRDEDDEEVDLRAGGRLGPYALIERLEETPAFIRWRARKRDAKAEVGVSVIRAHPLAPAMRRRFQDDARLLGTRPHPNVEKILEVEQIEETLYIATELLQGDTLPQWGGARPRSPRESVALMLPVLDALRHVHALEISHGGLDASRIVITTDGVPHVCGFCLSGFRLVATGGTEYSAAFADTATTAARADWAPPEVADDDTQPTPPDLRAFGEVLERLLGDDAPALLQRACSRMQGWEGPGATFDEARAALASFLSATHG